MGLLRIAQEEKLAYPDAANFEVPITTFDRPLL